MWEKRKPAQPLADRPLVLINAKATLDQRLQIDAAPAHHAVRLGLWPRLEESRKLSFLVSRGAAPGALRSISPDRPAALNRGTLLAQRLPVHSAQPRRRIPAHSVVDRRNRQQTPYLSSVLRPSRRRPNPLCIAIRSP